MYYTSFIKTANTESNSLTFLSIVRLFYFNTITSRSEGRKDSNSPSFKFFFKFLFLYFLNITLNTLHTIIHFSSTSIITQTLYTLCRKKNRPPSMTTNKNNFPQFPCSHLGFCRRFVECTVSLSSRHTYTCLSRTLTLLSFFHLDTRIDWRINQRQN